MSDIKRDNSAAETILNARYLRRDSTGEICETIDDMFNRVANTIAAVDSNYGANAHDIAELAKRFKDAMVSYNFLPNSPTLMNAGTEIGQLSACFVIPIEDNMEGIFEAVKNTAIIHKTGGGTGFNFSAIRAKDSVVSSTGGRASGPISFMKVFDAATDVVKQGGKRRGASLGTIRVDHSDILEFITCKDNMNILNNFNISVAITDEFMEALNCNSSYNIYDYNHKIVATKDANEVFDLIIHQAWKNGEPGILFIDEINRKNMYGTIESTNPCGEQPLLPFESCNLGSINLANMVNSTRTDVDYEKLVDTISLAIHFLDNVIDANNYPLKQIDEVTKKTRKIGLGVMGFADMLCMIGVPYNSELAILIATNLMAIINTAAKEASNILGSYRGTFPVYPEIADKLDPQYTTPRNLYVTTIAPTGTISMIAGTSSGVEPLFAVAYFKQCLDDNKFVEVNPYFKQDLIDAGVYSEELMQKVCQSGSVQGIDAIPKSIRDIYVVAHDISPESHIRMQAAFQAHVDNAISKTINFSNSATEDDIRKAYILAYQSGCKGVTVYRDGSRLNQVLNLNEKEEDIPDKIETIVTPTRKRRSEYQYGFTRKMAIGCGSIYITVNYDENGDILEVFTTLGKNGGCASQSEATARLASLAFSSGIDPKEVIRQIRGIKCPNCIRSRSDGTKIIGLSCPDSIAQTLEDFLKNRESIVNTNRLTSGLEPMEATSSEPVKVVVNPCPKCGRELRNESGCLSCVCGWSKCN